MSGTPTKLNPMFDPWEIVAANSWLEIHHVRMPDGKPGATDGKSAIWLDDRLTHRERRCVLTHELVHLKYGHCECQELKVERRVCRETAHLLIPVTHLMERSRECNAGLEALAEELEVTAHVLRDRIDSLSAVEYGMLRDCEAVISADVSW